MKKKTTLAGTLTAIALIGICAAFVMMMTGDPYTGFFGLFTNYGSAIVGAAALIAWAWGRPFSYAATILMGGAITGIGLIFGSMMLANWLVDTQREARNAKQEEEMARVYRSARAYYYQNVTYEPRKNKIVARAPVASNLFAHPVFIIPFGEAFVLIIEATDAWAFDGKTSTPVDFDGSVENGTTITPGKFTFQGKRYSTDKIEFSDLNYGYDHGGSGKFVNPTLLDAIAPAPEAASSGSR